MKRDKVFTKEDILDMLDSFSYDIEHFRNELDDGTLIEEDDTNRANNSFFLNLVYSNWHIVVVNKVNGLTYQEYKDWCKEIGVKVDD